jgi:hypothetical protein
MGHIISSSIVYVGTARLPQPLVSSVAGLAVELVVDPATGRVVAASTNVGLPSLDRLIWEVVVGTPVSDAPETALLEIEVRYCSPLTTAVCRALETALRRAQQDACRPLANRGHRPGSPAANGAKPCRSTLAVAAN